MNTLNRFQLASIIEYLDDAYAALPPSGVPGLESKAAWSIRMARKALCQAAFSDVAIDQSALAERVAEVGDG